MRVAESIKEMLNSSRFVYIQEAIGIGFLAAVIKAIFSAFPLIELYAFLAPIVMVAFGIKSWAGTKNGGEKG